MTRTLSTKGAEWLDWLPPFYSEDEYTKAVVDSVAREFQRLEDRATTIRTTVFPTQATDAYGFLPLWETILGLPVAPAGASVANRQALVVARLTKRHSAAGSDWVDRFNAAMDTPTWTHSENTPGSYQLTIRVPYGATSYTGAQIKALAQQISPAHLQLLFGYNQGFIVGVSLVGDVL